MLAASSSPTVQCMKETFAVLWAINGDACAGSLELTDRRLELRARGRTFSAPVDAVRQLTIERGAAARINGLAVLQLRFSRGDVLRVASLQGMGVLHELAAALSL